MVVQENPYHYPPAGERHGTNLNTSVRYGPNGETTTTTTTRTVRSSRSGGGDLQQRDPEDYVNCCGCCSMECGMVVLLIWENLGLASAFDRISKVYKNWSDVTDKQKPLYFSIVAFYILSIIPQIFFIFTFCRYICCTSKPVALDRHKLIRGIDALIVKAVLAFGVVGIICLFLGSDTQTSLGISLLLACLFEVLLLLWWRSSFVQWWRIKIN